jgi:hypothetical protein
MDLLSEGYRPRGRRPVAGAVGATCEALIAAFCRREKSLSCCWEKGWLVGAVGVEIAPLTSKSRQWKALPTARHPNC